MLPWNEFSEAMSNDITLPDIAGAAGNLLIEAILKVGALSPPRAILYTMLVYKIFI